MSGKPSPQVSFFSPEFADPSCLERGTLPWLLRTYAAMLVPVWLFKRWHGDGGPGRPPWDAHVLMSTCILRFSEEGMSRKAMVRRLKHDISWLAAAGLEIGSATPSESTFCRFEKYLRERDSSTNLPRYLLLHEHLVRVCGGAGILKRPIWSFDSTPMWCYGATIDTVRLLGDGLRRLGGKWARLTGQSRSAVAESWELPLLMAKSTKGNYRVDWRDPDARAKVVDRVANDVVRVVDRVLRNLDAVRRNKRKGLCRLCRRLLRVIRDDLKRDEQGRLVVADHVAADRLVSLTDPQARHSRRSKSKPFEGFKVAVLGDVVSGLIASLTVTPANLHDAGPGSRLIRRAQRLVGDIERVLGDTAYGGADLHRLSRDLLGVDVISPPPPVPRRPGKLNISDFQIDLPGKAALCPKGELTTDFRESKTGTHAFCWPKATCGPCPLRTACFGASQKSKRLLIRPNFEELQFLRERWEDEEVREAYRVRSQCERLVNQVTRHGGRQARAWGLQAATLQTHFVVMRSNLGILARKLANPSEPPDSLRCCRAANDPVALPTEATGTGG